MIILKSKWPPSGFPGIHLVVRTWAHSARLIQNYRKGKCLNHQHVLGPYGLWRQTVQVSKYPSKYPPALLRIKPKAFIVYFGPAYDDLATSTTVPFEEVISQINLPVSACTESETWNNDSIRAWQTTSFMIEPQTIQRSFPHNIWPPSPLSRPMDANLAFMNACQNYLSQAIITTLVQQKISNQSNSFFFHCHVLIDQ